MTDENTRLEAVRALLDDEVARDVRTNWETIFSNESLTPDTQSGQFKKQFYDLLITEMEEGYQRLDKVRREKRRRAGRSGGYIPPQMRINGGIGRFLFACFKWHDLSLATQTAGIEAKGLEDIAEAFGFRIDPAENERQFLKPEERQKVINKEKDRDYNKWLFGMVIAGFSGMIVVLIGYARRQGWL